MENEKTIQKEIFKPISQNVLFGLCKDMDSGEWESQINTGQIWPLSANEKEKSYR